MNENLDLTKILKDRPEGIILYSTLCGEVKFKGIEGDIIVTHNVEYGDEIDFSKDGSFFVFHGGECILFPSKDNRDWSAFKVPNKLPKTWEEFCENHPIKESEYYIDKFSNIDTFVGSTFKRDSIYDKSVLPNEHYAEAMLALCQLIQLRDCYNDGWEPDWTNNEIKYIIQCNNNMVIKNIKYGEQSVLAFKTMEIRNEFYNNFIDLIKLAKPLL